MADTGLFGYGHAGNNDWQEAATNCADQIDPPPGANLGFLYVSDAHAGQFEAISALMTERTGVSNWVGTTGIGVCATGREYFDEPAIAAMVGHFPDDAFATFEEFGNDRATFLAGLGPRASSGDGHFALVHGDPRHPELMQQVPELAQSANCFLAGGLASSRGAYGHIAGAMTEGALSGVIFSADVPVATGLSQGCSPIGPAREITRCEDNIAIEIDGSPALDILREDIGEVLSRDLRRIGGYIFAAFPVAGSDRADYMVRNLVGIDEANGLLGIGAPLEVGDRIMFCRRDRQTAREDLDRMLDDLKRRATTPIKGAIYYTCLGRGPNMFDGESAELMAIRDKLGDIPLVGFFCNGEISHDRVYSYTGVLSLFL